MSAKVNKHVTYGVIHVSPLPLILLRYTTVTSINPDWMYRIWIQICHFVIFSSYMLHLISNFLVVKAKQALCEEVLRFKIVVVRTTILVQLELLF
jgi:hypothetical protein